LIIPDPLYGKHGALWVSGSYLSKSGVGGIKCLFNSVFFFSERLI
jgi:hypothetical protein